MAEGYQLRLGPPVDRHGELKPGESATLGAGDARIVYPASEPVHCRFEVTSRGLEVFNLSKAGTFVNGRKVERSLVKDGDELKVGTNPAGIKVWVRTPGSGDILTSAERFTAQPSATTQQKTQAFSREALAAAAAAASAAAKPAAPSPQVAPVPPTPGAAAPQPPAPPQVAPVPPAPGGSPAAPSASAAPALTFKPPVAGGNMAVTVSPGSFAPKPPPALTRRYDPEALRAQAAQAQTSTASPAAPAKPADAGGTRAFRMSAAEEQRAEPKYRERDGSALLGTANPTAPVELTRRALFAKKAEADERSFQPAPEFQPASDEGPEANVVGASSSKTLTLDPSLRTETSEERQIRSELEASGLDVLARLGGGANAIVYRARRRDLGQEVVVKAVRVQQGDPDGRSARLLAEGKVAARLHHPGIVQVHGTFRGRTFIAIVLESLRGISLAEEVAARGGLTAREAVVLGDRLAKALRNAHNQGVVHRDVAPRNVMLTEQGELKLLGFGFATSADGGDAPASGGATGTPGFVAPEQVANPQTADKRVDVYGLGATLYFALAGKAPEKQPGSEEVVPISQVVQGAAGPLARLIARALRPNPAERFESCEAMVAAIREASGAVSETGSFRKKGAMTALIQAAALEPEAPAGPRPMGFQGRLAGREVVGLLRLVEAGRKTGWLEVHGDAPDGSKVTGAVHFREGEFVRAAVQGKRSVVDALVEVAMLPAVDFAIVFGPLDALGPTEERSPVALTLQAVAERMRAATA